MTKQLDPYTIELDTDCENDWEWDSTALGVQAHIDDMGVEYFHIAGTGMGWMRSQGFIVADRNNLIAALGLDGSYRLVFTFTPGAKTATAMRYSHDEPVGASFTIREATDQECNDWL